MIKAKFTIPMRYRLLPELTAAITLICRDKGGVLMERHDRWRLLVTASFPDAPEMWDFLKDYPKARLVGYVSL